MESARNQARDVATVVGRYGVAYPSVATASAYAIAMVAGPTFDTVLFAVFAITAVVTGAGAMSGSPSSDVLQSGAGIAGGANPGEQWGATLLVKLTLFGLGIAIALTIHALWWV
jgi:hypothetical protein